MSVYHRSIRDCARRDSIAERIADLNDHLTSVVYASISHALPTRHALAFALAMSVGHLRQSEAWAFLLTGGNGTTAGSTPPISAPPANPWPRWLKDSAWRSVLEASIRIPALQGLTEGVRTDEDGWRRVVESEQPHEEQLPGVWERLRYACTTSCHAHNSSAYLLKQLRVVRVTKISDGVKVRPYLGKSMGGRREQERKCCVIASLACLSETRMRGIKDSLTQSALRTKL